MATTKRTYKKKSTKKSDALVEVKEGPDLTPSGPIRRPGRPPKAKPPEFTMTVHLPTKEIELVFENNRDFQRAFKQIGYNCAAGRPACVVSGGVEYFFCGVSYVSRSV
tara:strand:- start:555 stop:878 length:324 start_codon:yes stop_codon:yes gene_type:complete